MSESPTDAQDRAEAARWRRRLREAEKQRDELAAQVEAMQREQVSALLSREHVEAEAVWATGTTLNDLLDAEGRPDPDKVKKAARSAAEALGITPGLYVPAEGRIPAPPKNTTFAAAFTPPENR